MTDDSIQEFKDTDIDYFVFTETFFNKNRLNLVVNNCEWECCTECNKLYLKNNLLDTY